MEVDLGLAETKLISDVVAVEPDGASGHFHDVSYLLCCLSFPDERSHLNFFWRKAVLF